jgi:UDP-glucose 4-epimerase
MILSNLMKILVTGGAGYVGSVTAATLVREGHAVVVFDNLSQGHAKAVPEGATFVRGDLTRLDEVRKAFEAHRPEVVMHFAGHIQVGESMQDPLKYLGENAFQGINLLQASLDFGVRRFVLSSTANLFDKPERIPIDEKAALIPGSPYGESKLYLERVLEWLDRTHGLKSACLRYFNAAGATERHGENHLPETHLIPVILQVALGQRKDIRVFGTDYDTPDGTCIRDYIHVSDLAEAHLLAIQALDRGSRRYNLGNGSGYSVNEVIDAARRITGHPIPVVAAPRREGDPARLVADSSLIRRELGWTPRIPELDRIVESAWAWMKKNPNGYGT